MNPASLNKKLAVSLHALETLPEYFSQVAQWHHQECERQGLHSTLSLRQQRLLLHVQQNPIPKTFILLRGKQLIGCVSLVNYAYRAPDSHQKIPGLPLWLSNLFVAETERNQGFGDMLVEAAKQYARGLGVGELWLSAAEYTEFYEKRGWDVVRRTRLGGRSINVMQIKV